MKTDKKQFFGKQHIIMWWLGDRRAEAVIVLRSSGVTRESTLLRPRCKSLRGTNKLLARLPWNMCHLFQETGSSFSPLISLLKIQRKCYSDTAGLEISPIVCLCTLELVVFVIFCHTMLMQHACSMSKCIKQDILPFCTSPTYAAR